MMIKHERFSIAIFSKYVFREIRQYVIRFSCMCWPMRHSCDKAFTLIQHRVDPWLQFDLKIGFNGWIPKIDLTFLWNTVQFTKTCDFSIDFNGWMPSNPRSIVTLCKTGPRGVTLNWMGTQILNFNFSGEPDLLNAEKVLNTNEV